MDLRQLRYFVTVAEELHFGRAAERLHISQPPLSLSIKQLESRLGVVLLLRTNKTVSLTSAGAMLYAEAVKLLAHAENVEDLANRIGTGIEGRIRVGFVGSMLFRGLPEAIRDFQAAHPRVDVVLREMNTGEQLDAVRREQLDVGFIHAATLPDGVEGKRLLEEPFLCCLPHGHPLSRRAVVPLRALSAESFVLFPRAVSPHYHDRIVSLCVRAGFSPRVQHEVNHWLTIVGLVAQHMGVALVPRSMREAAIGRVVFRPIDDNSVKSEALSIWRAGRNVPTLPQFIDTVARRAGKRRATRVSP